MYPSYVIYWIEWWFLGTTDAHANHLLERPAGTCRCACQRILRRQVAVMGQSAFMQKQYVLTACRLLCLCAVVAVVRGHLTGACYHLAVQQSDSYQVNFHKLFALCLHASLSH
jgi:hypothetical protein